MRALTVTGGGLAALAALLLTWFVPLLLALTALGLTVAPAVVVSYLLADDHVPVGNTEATAWVTVVLNTGLALGASLAGVAVEARSPAAAMLAAAAASVLLIVLVRGGARRSA